MVTDLRHALRLFMRRPAFTCAIVLTLALGIGANTAMFSLVYAVLLRPLPYNDPDRLVFAWRDAGVRTGLEHPRHAVLTGTHVIDWQEQSGVFESFAVVLSWEGNLDPQMDLIHREGAERLRGALVTTNFFELLGARAALGRVFDSRDRSSDAALVVIGDGLWRRRFGADPAIVGQTISLLTGRGASRGKPGQYTIVGVLPPSFRFTYPKETELWAVLPWERIRPTRAIQYQMVGRLKPGVGTSQAAAVLTTIQQNIERGYGFPEDRVRESRAFVETLPDHVASSVRSGMLLLLSGAILVLTIACVNVALLLMALIVDRRREVALRTALGAGRFRVARQMLCEGLLLASAGGMLGTGLAWTLMPAIRALVPPVVPRGDEMVTDTRVLGFALAASVATAVLCSLAPAWHARRRDVQAGLRRSGGTVTADRVVTRWRRSIVAAQVTVVFVLLVTAGLFLNSFWRLQHVDLGFSGEGLITMEMRLLNPRHHLPGRMAAFQRDVMERVRAVPGVLEASMTSAVPFRGVDFLRAMEPVGEGRARAAHFRPVDPEYFDVMRIRRLAGRGFRASDDESAPRVVIVSEQYGREVFGEVSPVGRRLDVGSEEAEIVGVVADVRTADVARPAMGAVYLPRAQEANEIVCLVVRPAQGVSGVAQAVRDAVRVVDPEQPVENITTMDRVVAASTAEERFYMVATAGFAAVAVLLALAGLAGVVSRTVTERVREIAIRISLGAEPAQLVRLAVGNGLLPVALGLIPGLAGAWAVSGLLRGFLFEVVPLDPLTHAAAAALLALAGAAACYLPARRAARVEPMTVLRAE